MKASRMLSVAQIRAAKDVRRVNRPQVVGYEHAVNVVCPSETELKEAQLLTKRKFH